MTATLPAADVIVVGGGAAGLAAARCLTAARLNVVVVEARDRVGGRIHTQHVPSVPVPVELGAEFIHGFPEQIWSLISAGRSAVYEVNDVHCRVRDGHLEPAGELWPHMQQIVRRIGAMRGADRSFRSVADAFWRTRATCDIKALAVAYVEGFNAADADGISARAVAAGEGDGSGGDRAFRWVHGYDQLMSMLRSQVAAAGATMLLRMAVQQIRWRRGHVTVTVRSDQSAAAQTFTARCAVVALPLGVLQATPHEEGAVQFTPALPLARAITDAVVMGDVVHVVLSFRSAFWNDPALPINRGACRLSDVGFAHIPGAPLPTWWTTAPIRAPVLTAWAGGPTARRLQQRGVDGTAACAVDTLAALLGLARSAVERELEGVFMHDWHGDAYSRGAYSYVRPGGLAGARRLSEPIEDTLYLAGEHTAAAGERGTVHGALASGERAARQLIGAMERAAAARRPSAHHVSKEGPMTKRSTAAARRNVRKAAEAARRKRTIAHLPKQVRTALGKKGAAAARRAKRRTAR